MGGTGHDFGFRTCDQPCHRGRIAADIHDSSAGSRVGEADILVFRPHVVTEVGLNQAHSADGAVVNQLFQPGSLGMTPIHKGFHEEHAALAYNPESVDGFRVVDG